MDLNKTFISDAKDESSENTKNRIEDISMLEDQTPPQEFITLRGNFAATTNNGGNQHNSHQENLLKLLESRFDKQDEKLSLIVKEFVDLRTSISFMSEKYEEVCSKTVQNEARITSLEKNQSKLEEHDIKIVELQRKVDSMEQQARQVNIEIHNLPERKGENLNLILQKIGSHIKITLSPEDVTHIHRVQHGVAVSKDNPKNIIAKFKSVTVRDNFLAAARMKKGIKTSDIGIAGTAQQIFLNEHLTVKNKILYQEVREAARNNSYRFVWIKHGTILVRQDETSPVFAIHTQDDIQRKMIKPLPQ